MLSCYEVCYNKLPYYHSLTFIDKKGISDMYTPEALLDAVLRQLRADMSEVLVDPWFTNASALTIQDDLFVVEAASELFRDTLTKRFTDNVSDIISDLLGRPARPLYVFGPEADSWKLQSDTSVYAGYTFEKYIVGNSNKFAHAAALAVANNPARLYNPLFIYGGSGLGKTHLLFAIANSLRKKHPSYRIVYIKSEEFMNEMVEAVKTSGFTDFRAKYRQADLSALLDILVRYSPVCDQRLRRVSDTVHAVSVRHDSDAKVACAWGKGEYDLLHKHLYERTHGH